MDLHFSWISVENFDMVLIVMHITLNHSYDFDLSCYYGDTMILCNLNVGIIQRQSKF
jgi:hypothetical protein